MYLGWVFGSLLKVLMGMVDLAFVNFIKKEVNKHCLFSGTSDRHKLPWSCVEQVVVWMGKDG